jgi:D-arabinose 1-dehydrogenase-like Zn-dependent alcohol dehydrogenase
MAIAGEAGIRVEYTTYALEQANEALAAIASDSVRGAAVLTTG